MSSNKLELLRNRFASRNSSGAPTSELPAQRGSADKSAKKGKGSDVRAIVVSTKERWGKPSIVCFVHALETANLGERDRVENNQLVIHPRSAAGHDGPDPDPISITCYQLIEITNNAKKADALAVGDAIWLHNFTAKAGKSRTFYDVSFTRRDYTTTGFSALSKTEHSLFYIPRFNPDSYDNDILLPIAPFPSKESDIRTPGVYAQMDFLDQQNLVQERDNTIFARFTLSVLQWKSGIEVDSVSVRLPNIRCWESTLSAFGIQNPSHWNALANTILRNVPFFIKGYVHKDSTMSLQESSSTTDTEYSLSVRVTSLIVDPERMLSHVALRVDADYARSVLATHPSADHEKHAWNSNASNFYNASEMASDKTLPDANQWFILPNIDAVIDERDTLNSMDNAGRQAWLEKHMQADTVACVFLRATKKRSAERAGFVAIGAT